MQNLDIYILTSIVATLFIVFGIAMYREFSRMGREGYQYNPNEKKYGRDALFVLAAKLLKMRKFQKKIRKLFTKLLIELLLIWKVMVSIFRKKLKMNLESKERNHFVNIVDYHRLKLMILIEL